MCGYIGIVGPAPVAADLYEGLLTLQHRGQDAAGFCTWDDGFKLVKGGGLVHDVFSADAAARLTGNMGVAQVRYPTVGYGGPDDAQPFLVSSPLPLAMAHNGNVINCPELKHELATECHRHVSSGCDVEVILNVLADELSRQDLTGTRDSMQDACFKAVEGVHKRVRGTYSVVTLIGHHGLLAFRDPYGIRPMIMGDRTTDAGRAICITSESVALDRLEFGRSRNLNAGEAVFVTPDGDIASRQIGRGDGAHPCIFEYVYFARPDSFIDTVSVYKTRLRLGQALARQVRERGLAPDVVIPVPDSARPAALALAQELKLDYREGFQKNRYVGRTFIMPGQDARHRSVRRKLNAIQIEFTGKKVLLVDDSLVRGTTAKALIELARRAGAAEVYLASTAPPIVHPCVYGIDMSTRQDLIAANHTIEEVRLEIGADALIYQSVDALVRSAKAGNPDLPGFCDACFTGVYPTGDVTPEVLDAIERERTDAHAAAAE